jgi:hypothetical protein
MNTYGTYAPHGARAVGSSNTDESIVVQQPYTKFSTRILKYYYIRFIPLAFEISGGWGEEMAKFFEECVRLKKRRTSAEMYHWCAIVRDTSWPH